MLTAVTGVPLDGSCRCGCGAQAIAERADDAALLAAARLTAERLERKKLSGGRRRVAAQRLLDIWHSRAEQPLDDRVHGRPAGFLGPPHPMWVQFWRERAEKL